MNYTLILVVVVLLFVFGRRIFRGTQGAAYSVQSIFLRPVIYIVLSLALMFGLELWQVGVLVIAIIAGVFAGRWLGQKSDIFEKDGKVMYTRSNMILAIWIVAFVIRLAIDFIADPALLQLLQGSGSASTLAAVAASSQGSLVPFLADILLAISAGLLFGEALVLRKNFNTKFKK